MTWSHADRPQRTIRTASGRELTLHVATDALDTGPVAAPFVADALGPQARPWETPDEGRSPVLAVQASDSLVSTYDEIIGYFLEGWLSLERINVCGLCELVTLGGDDEGSCRHRLDWGLFFPTDVSRERVLSFDGRAGDPAAEAAACEARVRDAGGVDLLLLCAEADGRVGLGEPGGAGPDATRVVTLSADLRGRLAAGPGGDASTAPEAGLTLGLALLREARQVVVLACGRAEGAALGRALTQPADLEARPLSFLQDHEGDCVLVVDEDAAGALNG